MDLPDFAGYSDRELLEHVAAQLGEIHAELEEFRPVLAIFKPNGGGSDVQRAGLLRSMRKAARGGG